MALRGDEDGRVAAGDGSAEQGQEGEQRIALRADDADDADGLVPGGDDTTQGGFLELSAELIGIGGEGEEALLTEGDFAFCLSGVAEETGETIGEFGGADAEVFGEVEENLGAQVRGIASPIARGAGGADSIADVLAVAGAGQAFDAAIGIVDGVGVVAIGAALRPPM